MDVKFMLNQSQSNLPTPEVQEEFGLLMSLSLDDLLDEREQQRFQGYVEQYPVLARQWRSWQLLDRQLTLLPAAEPVDGFVERFEVRLAQQDRRRLLGRNLLIAALIVVVWVGMLVGGTALAAYVLLYQGNWLVELVHTLAYYGSAITRWGETFWNAFTSLVATPQAIGFAIGYVAVASALLALWVRFLRQSTREAEMSAPFNEPLGV